MANTFPSPYMDLQIPTPAVAPGPEWATLLNECLLRIDQHAHTPGNGFPLSSSSIIVTTDFLFNSNNAILLRSVRFINQTSLLSEPTDLGAIYERGGDLYYNNATGTPVQITNGTGVAGTPGSIGSLVIPASATYVLANQAFVFQSGTNIAGNIDGRNFILRNSTVSSFGLTLSPPAAMVNDYTLTLPSLPSQTNVMILSPVGVMSSITYDQVGQGMSSVGANAIADTRTRSTGVSVAAGGVAVSNSCGTFVTVSTVLVDVPNLSVSITTTGRPVFLMLISDGTLNTSGIATQTGSTVNSVATNVSFVRGGSEISRFKFFITGAPSLMGIQDAGNVTHVDVVAAGTYTYKVQISASAGTPSSALAFWLKLVAYEL